MDDAHFRAGVGACITDGQGRVLACRRLGSTDGAWQMPQGGMAATEEPEDCLWRELHEELGIGSGALTLARAHPGWLAYELPPMARSAKVGRGQVQKWFLLGASAALQPRLDQREFDGWQWMTPTALLASAVEFRRPVYTQVLREFGLSGSG